MDISCKYMENSGLWWNIRISPAFIDISNQNNSVHISVDVSTDKNQIEYKYLEGYSSNAHIEEGHFQFSNCKLIVGTRDYSNVNAVPPFGLIEEGWAEFEGCGCKTKTIIPFEVARIVIAIANGLSVEDIEGMGALNLKQMN